VVLHRHNFTIRDVPSGDHIFFCVRDPVARFLSRYHVRRAEGRPRHYYPWNDAEREIFTRYDSPQELAHALDDPDPVTRGHAHWAMRKLRHQKTYRRWLRDTDQLRLDRRRIVYILRQETLRRDWQQLRDVLALPSDVRLPHGRRHAHRTYRGVTDELDVRALRNLRAYYDDDYEILRWCDQLRALKGWGVRPAPTRLGRLRQRLARLRGLPALAPTRRVLRIRHRRRMRRWAGRARWAGRRLGVVSPREDG
jgi:hypothetical protein